MPLLSGLRGTFTRRKPAVVDLTTSQAGALARHADTHIESKASLRSMGTESESETRSGRSIRMTTVNSAHLDEVMGLVRTISSHLETQSSRTQWLIDCMERMPQALDALPEINRQNARMLDVVSEYLGHARRRDDVLNETLGGIASATHRHTDVLGLIEQQMDASCRSTESLVSNLGEFRQALRDLAGANSKTTAVLSALSRANEDRERELTAILRTTQKWMIAAMGCCAAAAVTAVAVAGFALLGG